MWLNELWQRWFGRTRPFPSHLRRRHPARRKGIGPRLEVLEDRTLLSGPGDAYLVGNVSGNPGEVSVPASAQGGSVHGTTFLGGSFTNIGGQVGGTSAGFGAQVGFNMSGRVGLNLGYDASSGGQVNATYQGVKLHQSFADATQFGQEVNFTPQNTNVSYTGGSFSTTGPSASVSADLEANLNGSVYGSVAYGLGKSSGSVNFNTNNIDQPLVNIGIGSDTNSNDLGLTLGLLGTDVSNVVNKLAQTPALSVKVNPAGPEVPIFIEGDLTGSTTPFMAKEGLNVGVGEAVDDTDVGGAVSLGDMSEYAPDLSLSANSLQSGGVLAASGEGKIADLSLQMGPVVGSLLDSLGFGFGQAADLLDSDTFSIGPASVTFTPASFTMGPGLSLDQTSTLAPVNTLTYHFSTPVVVTLDGQVQNGGNPESSVTFTPGVDTVGVEFNGTPITVTPTWNFNVDYTDVLDLDADLSGTLTAGTVKLGFGPLGSPMVGPAYTQNFDLANFKLATVLDQTYSLFNQSLSQTLPSFVIGGGFKTSLVVATTADSNTPFGGQGPNPGSLRAAVESANANYQQTPTGSQVIHLGSGTYSLTLTSARGGGALGSYGGLYVTAGNLTIAGAGDGKTIIKAGPSLGDRLFNVGRGANLTLEGVSIEGGNAPTGGGIYNSGTLTIDNSTITDNSAVSGGGIYNNRVYGDSNTNDATLTIDNSTISGNSADTGGGVYSSPLGTVTVNNSTIASNEADESGGGIFSNGALTVSNSTIADNLATLDNSASTINSGYGGGIMENTGTLTVSNSIIVGNKAGIGGGVGVFGTATFLNSTIYSNSATGATSADIAGKGGGIYAAGSSLTLQNTIVAGNNANSILYNGGAVAGNGPDIYGTMSNTSDYNLIGDDVGAGFTGFNGEHDIVGTNAAPVNPLLAPLGNYGGPTQTMPLLPGSPAIDAGSNSFAAGAGLLTDQRGYSRIVNQFADIGATEYQYHLGLSGYLVAGSTPGTVQYVYTVANNGPDPVQGAILTVSLPTGIALQSPTVPTDWIETDSGSGNGGTLTFENEATIQLPFSPPITVPAELEPGQSATFTVTAQLQNTALGANLSSTARVSPTTWDTNPQNNSVTLTINNEQEGQAFQQQAGLSFLSNVKLFHFTDVPIVSAPTVSSSGGSLPAGTYDYTVTTTTAKGESIPSNEVTATTTGVNSTVALTWNPVAGATGYKVYRGTSPGAENTLVTTIASGSTASFTDTGSETTSPASPLTAESFTASVYWGDNSSNTSSDGSGTVSLVADPNGGFDVIGSHTYAEAGSYTITVTVTGSDGTTYSQQVAQDFNNTVKLFHFTVPNPPVANTPTVSDSGSSLAAGTYYYTVTSMTPNGESTPSSEVSANVPTNDASSVTLTWGPVAGATGYKVYRGTSPGAENTLIATTTSGSSVSFTDTGSEATSPASPPSPPTASDFTANVGWGDGSGNTSSDGSGTVSVVADLNGGFDVLGSHTYAEEDNYGAAVAVTGLDGAKYSNGNVSNPQQLFVVADAPLTAGALTPPPNATINQPISSTTLTNIVLYHFTDPTNPNATASDFTASVDWGDNRSNTSSDNTGTVSVVADPNGGFDVVGVSHTYAQTGSFKISVSVAGSDSTTSDQPNVFTFNNGALLFHFTDADPNATAADYTAKVQWGDGKTNSTNDGTGTVSVIADPTGGFDVIGSHIYTQILNPGTFSVQVSDAGGSSTSASASNFQVLYPDQPLTSGTLNVPSVTTEGQSINQQVLFSFTDDDVDALASDYLATVSWGDGTFNSSNDNSGSVQVVEVGTVTGGLLFNVVGSHTYGEGNIYFAVKVTDLGDTRSTTPEPDRGGQVTSAVSATPLNITDPPVAVTAGPTFTATQNILSAVQTVATFTDPGGPEPDATEPNLSPAPYIATIQWGDGSITVSSLAAQTNYAAPSLAGSYVPVANTPSASSSGGSLAAGTYYYTVTSTTAGGESMPSNEVSMTTGSNGAVTLSWGQVAGATGYRIYRGTSPGGENTLVATVTSGTTVSFTDTGSEKTFAAPSQQLIGHDLVSVENVPGIVRDSNGQTFSINLAHQYAEGGNYTITTTVLHGGLTSGPRTTQAFVADQVTATGGFSIAGNAGVSTGNQTVATFTDPGGAGPLSDYSASIDWGDGAFGQPDITNGAISYNATTQVFTVSGVHTYASANTYPISVTISNFNLLPVTVNSTANIIQVTPTVNVTDAGGTYNGSSFQATATATGLGGTTIPGSFTFDYYDNTTSTDLGPTAPVNAGNYTVTAAFTSGSPTYSNNSAKTTFTINQLAVTLSGSRTYDGTDTAAAGILTVSNAVSGDTVYVASGSATLAGKDVGSETISSIGTLTLGGTSASNYTLTGVTGSVTITSAALTISAVSDTKVYDGTTSSSKTPTFQVANEPVNTLYGTDTLTGLSQAFTSKDVLGTNGSTLTVNAGYTVNDGDNGKDYKVTVAADSGTITPAPLTVTASPESMTYGGTVPALTYTYTGLVNGDSSVNFTGSLATTATSSSAVGNYAITENTLAATGNYTIGTFIAGNLQVNQAALTVTANNTSRYYGLTNPTFTYTISGFVNGDTASVVSGTPSFSTTATASSPPGTYTITIGQSTLSTENYSFSLVNGTLTVNAAPLSATAVNFSATAGALFSGTVATFTNADPFGSAASYTALINWGDGSSSYGVISGGTGPTLTVTGSHTFADPVNKTVRVQISHNLGYTTTATVYDTATVTSLGQTVQAGEGPGIGFWHNDNGQALITSFNGGSGSTALADWLASAFPNLYGVNAGTHNLTGMTNTQVALFYLSLFNESGPKLDAQVMAAALNVYATTLALGGAWGETYGFLVDAYGLGARWYNVGSNGAASGVANNTTLNVYEILLAANAQAVGGVLYNGNSTLQNEAINIFGGINQMGGGV